MEKKELEDALKAYKEAIEAKQAELKEAAEKEKAELKAEIEKIKADYKQAQDQLDAMSTEVKKMQKGGVKDEKTITFEQGVRELINSDEFKTAKSNKFAGAKIFEVKASTADITGTVNLTQGKMAVGFDPLRSLAFLPYVNTGFVGANKNRVLWMEGAFTSNVGYVSEGTGQATADTGSATQKDRAMAKISAKLPLTAELLEDADYIASALRMKMQENALLFLDSEIYGGDGNDSTAKNHIYGIKGHATAFSAATAGVATAIENANIGDLIDACLLQQKLAHFTGANVLWINPADFMKFKKTKTTYGEYLFTQDVNGTYRINGLQVIETTAVTANTLLVGDSGKIQFWWKRNPEIKFSQMNGTDFADDAYLAVMFLRGQVVIEGPDKKAFTYVSDIAAAVTAITAA